MDAARLALALCVLLGDEVRAAALPAACCWCDGDTPVSERSTLDSDGRRHELVFSDEFETLGRDFANGRDKRWTAINKSDYTNGSPMRYMPEAVTTVLDRGAYMRVSSNASVDDKEWRECALRRVVGRATRPFLARQRAGCEPLLRAMLGAARDERPSRTAR